MRGVCPVMHLHRARPPVMTMLGSLAKLPRLLVHARAQLRLSGIVACRWLQGNSRIAHPENDLETRHAGPQCVAML
jgi:hypothetical protein